MHVIFSRKGFDSSSGGMPSPILPDGTLLSLPIPADFGPTRYCDLKAPDGKTYSALMRELGWNVQRHRRAWRNGSAVCHADPDLRVEACPRPQGWRPAFGQIGIGQTQLARHDIHAGDVFLFFGLFRHTERQGKKLAFVPGTRPIHLIYGWLTVDSIAELSDETLRARSLERWPWLAHHPHACDPSKWARRITRNGPNRIYLGKANATGPLWFSPSRVLTRDGLSASRWRRFPWMNKRANAGFSRCNAPNLLHDDYLDTHTGRWQELVVRSEDYPQVQPWLDEITGE